MVVGTPGQRPRSWAIGGIVATFVASSLGFWMPGIGLPRLDFAALNGNLMVPDLAAASFAWSVGALETYALGALLAIVYGRYLRSRLPGTGPTRGVIWGAVLLVFSGLAGFPLLFGAGPFGVDWHPAMPASLVIWHLVWGLALGLTDDAETGE